MGVAFKNQLWQAAQREANQLGKPFDSAAEDQLKSMIDQGVDHMQSSEVENDPSRVQEAERNIVQFVQAMDNDAQRRGQSELDIASYNAARNICPLWPYC